MDRDAGEPAHKKHALTRRVELSFQIHLLPESQIQQ